jgi:uncharacterized damage-inducible protein DinB
MMFDGACAGRNLERNRCSRHALPNVRSAQAMLALLQDLIRHKAHSNALLLRAVSQDEAAARDRELRSLLHHIILANRFWLLSSLGEPFSVDDESRVPEAIGALIERYRETHDRELAWVSHITDAELSRTLRSPFIPGGERTVGEALTQVCLHSHGHRAQCATRLRILGGTPPAMDFILWVQNRPAPDWPDAA